MSFLLWFVGCGSMRPQIIKVTAPEVNTIMELDTRQRFLDCMTLLNKDGFNQTLILPSCETVFGNKVI